MSANFGLYVHVPFCSSRCDYCAFATWVGAEQLIDEYIDALVTELRLAWSSGIMRSPDTLYFGGGTPSLIQPHHIERIVREANVKTDGEITIECNPESTTKSKLHEYRESGINRISFGVQSLSKEVLKCLGRDHEPGDIYRVVDAMGDVGFDNYSVDVIYGSVAENEKILEQTIEGLLSLSPAPLHFSAYALTVEQGTPLSRDTTRHPDEDHQANAYKLIDSLLTEAGYEWYEISNWAKPAKHSSHNWNYWMQGEYLGVGCAAHSHIDSRRFWNIFNLNRYLAGIRSEKSAVAGSEDIVDDTKIIEALELLIRTNVGVPAQSITDVEEISFLLDQQGAITRLTLEGRLLANQVIMRFDPSLVSSDEVSELQNHDPWGKAVDASSK